MNQAHSVDDMQPDTREETQILVGEPIMVIGIGVDNTHASGCDAVEPTFIERLQNDE